MIKLTEQKHMDMYLKNIPKQQLSEYVKELIKETILDYGKKVESDQQQHIIKRVWEMLKHWRYNNWTLGEIIDAFHLGKVGTYGGESRVSVAGVERWLENYGQSRMKKIVTQRIEQKAQYDNTEKSMLGNELGAAMLWKRQLPKEQRAAFNQLRKNGIEVLHKIHECWQTNIDPLTMILDEKGEIKV